MENVLGNLATMALEKARLFFLVFTSKEFLLQFHIPETSWKF